ncbi:hypothetical protein J6590_106658, partial [Homalodisca vitripennis]
SESVTARRGAAPAPSCPRDSSPLPNSYAWYCPGTCALATPSPLYSLRLCLAIFLGETILIHKERCRGCSNPETTIIEKTIYALVLMLTEDSARKAINSHKVLHKRVHNERASAAVTTSMIAAPPRRLVPPTYGNAALTHSAATICIINEGRTRRFRHFGVN